MALQTAIPIRFTDFFPSGAFMVGEVEPVSKWPDDGKLIGQDIDKHSEWPLWQVRVIDPDPTARKGQNELVVKIASIKPPVAPPEATGLPFRPVEFEDLSVTPYVRETGERPRVAFSLRAKDMKPAPKASA